MSIRHVVITYTFAALASIPTSSVAENLGPFTLVDSKPISQLWLNPGFYTYHFQSDRGFNNNNFGLGAEYRYTTTSSIALGGFHNSDWQTTHYVGWYWHPVTLGPVRLGAALSGMDGYSRVNHGGWFPALLPVASLEYNHLGLNMVFVPSYKETLHGGLSFQLKLKAY